MKKKSIFFLLLSYSLCSFSQEVHQLVDIQQINPHIVVDLRYASSNNFTGEVIYTFNTCYLIHPAARALSLAQEELEKLGCGLKVWDGFRPLEAQKKLWALVPDERYVSNPSKGGRH